MVDNMVDIHQLVDQLVDQLANLASTFSDAAVDSLAIMMEGELRVLCQLEALALRGEALVCQISLQKQMGFIYEKLENVKISERCLKLR